MTFLAGRFGEIRAFRKTPLWMVFRLSSPTRLWFITYSDGLFPKTNIVCGVVGFVMKIQKDRSMLSFIRGQHLLVLKGSIAD